MNPRPDVKDRLAKSAYSTQVYGLLADLTVLLHAGFVLFVVLGGALVWRWPRLAWLHLPAVVWAIGIEWVGGICPLTDLEHWLRAASGVGVAEGDFVDRFVLWWLYPNGLTRTHQMVLGAALLMVNLVVYARWLRLRQVSSTPGRDRPSTAPPADQGPVA